MGKNKTELRQNERQLEKNRGFKMSQNQQAKLFNLANRVFQDRGYKAAHSSQSKQKNQQIQLVFHCSLKYLARPV